MEQQQQRLSCCCCCSIQNIKQQLYLLSYSHFVKLFSTNIFVFNRSLYLSLHSISFIFFFFFSLAILARKLNEIEMKIDKKKKKMNILTLSLTKINKVFITVVRSPRARVFRASLNLPDSCIWRIIMKNAIVRIWSIIRAL